MMARIRELLAKARQRVFPPVAADIADALELLRYRSMQAQVPLLYCVMLTVIPLTMSIAFAEASPLVHTGLPTLVLVLCAGRLYWWLGHRRATPDAQTARRNSRRMLIVASLIAALCSTWTVLGWMSAVPGDRSYFPMFMAMGTLSAAFCMSNSRGYALMLLTAGLGPQIAMLAIAGERLDRVAALIISVAAAFLIRVILQRHTGLIELLTLQAQMRDLADTDALTGLANRRRLMERLSHDLAEGRGVAVLLVDLDGFKAVNDTHGHATGDALLRAVGGRLREAAGEKGLAARLGGDEFAVVLGARDEAEVSALADRLLIALIEPVFAGPVRLRIGASLGFAVAEPGERDPEPLLARADRRLYAAKHARGGTLSGQSATMSAGAIGNAA